MNSILLLSNTQQVRKQIEEICSEFKLLIKVCKNVTEFILELEENNYQTIIIDFGIDDSSRDLVRISKKFRPRVPIIFITDEDNKQLLQKIVEEGVFYIFINSLSKNILIEVINSSIVYEIKSNNTINY